MAISTVRALFNGTWYTLTLNSSTGLYEVQLTAPSTPGEKAITVQATLSSGVTTSGAAIIGVARELTPPVVTITGPTAGAWYSNARQPVTFTLRDEAGGSGVDLSTLAFVLDGKTLTSTSTGMVCTAVTNGYDCTYTPPAALSEGSHTVSISVRDVAENQSATVSRSWNIDTAAPALTVISPTANLITSQRDLTITGTVSDTGSGVKSLTINGTSVTVTNGQFSYPVTLAEGVNTYTIIATDTSGQTTTVTRMVTLDTAPPVLTITSPADGLLTSNPALTVTGTVSDAASGVKSLIVNGISVSVSSGAFSQPVTLAEGTNTITATVTDNAGFTTTITRTVILDTVAPSLDVTFPTDGLITNQNPTWIIAKAGDATSGVASLTVNGTIVPPNSSGQYLYKITMLEGENNYTIVASDQAGNTTTVTRAVVLDTIAPTVSITSPTAGAWIIDNKVPVTFTLLDSGTGVDLDTLSITLDGTEYIRPFNGLATTEITGGYSCTYTPPSTWRDGNHTISIAVQDAAGNVSDTATLDWNIDTEGPELSVTHPPPDFATNQTKLSVTGTARDIGIGLESLSVNGVKTAAIDGAFSYSVNLSEGYNTVTVTAVDSLGHSSTVTRSVLLDTTPPVFRYVHITPDLDAVPLGEWFIIRAVMADSPKPKSKETVTGMVNGQPITLTEGPELTWTVKIPRADSDVYDVALTARDAAGNSAEYHNIFPCGMESKWTWEPIDFLNFWDLNRIERNTDYVRQWLFEMGYNPEITTIKTDWTEPDIPTQSDIDRVRRNVDALQVALFQLKEWRTITYNNGFDYEQVNAIEWDLHIMDKWLVVVANTFKVYSGQIYSGMWT